MFHSENYKNKQCGLCWRDSRPGERSKDWKQPVLSATERSVQQYEAEWGWSLQITIIETIRDHENYKRENDREKSDEEQECAWECDLYSAPSN